MADEDSMLIRSQLFYMWQPHGRLGFYVVRKRFSNNGNVHRFKLALHVWKPVVGAGTSPVAVDEDDFF